MAADLATPAPSTVAVFEPAGPRVRAPAARPRASTTPRSRPPRSRSGPATPSRSWFASASRCHRRPTRSTSTGCCAPPTPARTCTCCASPRASFDIVGSSPGGAGHGPGRDGHHAPDRRHPAARRTAEEDCGWRRTCWPTRRSAPSTSCWSTSAATTSAGSARAGTVEVRRLLAVERYSHVMHLVSTVTGRAGRRAATRFDAVDRLLPGGHAVRARRSRARWRSSRSSSPPGAALYGGVVGYLDFAGRRRHRDRHPHRAAARRASPTCRPAAGSSPTPTRRPRTPSAGTRRGAVLSAIATAEALAASGR